METHITILVDNTAGGLRGTVAEHGFAAWISQNGGQTLFDTGAGQALPLNARCLNKDFQQLERVILSHGHWDHTGGLPTVLAARETTEIIAHPGIFLERFSKRSRSAASPYREVGIPFTRTELEQAGAQFILHTAFTKVAPGLWFSGEIPRPTGWQTSDPGLVLKQEGAEVTDPMADDASLLFETLSGPVVLLGCAHAGVETILPYLAKQSGHSAFHAVIGGTHLMHADAARIDTVIAVFERYQVQQIVATHCTGFPTMARFYQHFGRRFQLSRVGMEFCF